jgi:thiamine kinase-like enzyme
MVSILTVIDDFIPLSMAAVSLPGVPYFDEIFPTDSAARVPFLYRILGLTIPIKDCVLKDLPSGWTNTVYRFDTPQQRYTVREYGSNTSLIIDRTAELGYVKALGFLTVFATFRNGAVLTYLEGVPTDVTMLRDPKISDALATFIAKFHKVTLGKPGPTVSDAWSRIDKCLAGTPEDLKGCDRRALVAKINAKRVFLEERFKDRPICLCHNDLTPANIIWDESTQSIGLIDYEYTYWNWPEYDIANHFFECGGWPISASSLSSTFSSGSSARI